MSCHGCDEDQRRAFRLLSVLDMADVPIWAVAALLNTSLTTAKARLEGLVDAQLIQVMGRDTLGQVRYGFHDLIRVFAVERLTDEEPPDARSAALQRVLSGYAQLVRFADAELRPGGRRRSEADTLGRRRVDPRSMALVATDAAGRLTVERSNLVAVIQQAHAAGLWGLTGALADNLVGFLEMRTHWDDWSSVADLALDAARHAGDRHAEAAALRTHGYLRWDQGRPHEAEPHYRTSLALLREQADRHDRAHALLELGYAYADMGPRRCA